jgi:hypothetical protein
LKDHHRKKDNPAKYGKPNSENKFFQNSFSLPNLKIRRMGKEQGLKEPFLKNSLAIKIIKPYLNENISKHL